MRLDEKTLNRLLPFLIFALFFTFTICLRLSTESLSTSDDPYYHARRASEIWTGGEVKMPKFSTLSDYPVNLYSLYHATMAPFTFGFHGNNYEMLIVGVKIYHSILDGLLFTLFFLLLRYYTENNSEKKLSLTVIGTLSLFAFSHIFSFRIMLERPHTLSIVFMLLIFWTTERKKLYHLFFIVCLLPFFYSTSFLALIPPFIYVIASMSYYGFSKEAFMPLCASITGLVFGILSRPDSLYYLYNGYLVHIMSLSRSIFTKTPNLPAEFKTSTTYITQEYWIFAFIILVIIILRKAHKDKIQSIPFTLWFMAITSIIFTLGFLVVSRTIEYAFPFALLFIFTSLPFLKITLKDFYHAMTEKKSIIIPFAIFIFVITFIAQTISIVWILNKAPSWDTYRSASAFIESHTDPNSIIYIPNWGMFPQAFFYNPNLNYTNGVDPTFTFMHNKKLYYEMDHLNSNEIICNKPVCDKETISAYDLLKNKIGVSYILVDSKLLQKDKLNLENLLENDGRFTLVFKDDKFPNIKVFGFNQ